MAALGIWHASFSVIDVYEITAAIVAVSRRSLTESRYSAGVKGQARRA